MMRKHHSNHFGLPTSKDDTWNFSERVNWENPGRLHYGSTLLWPTSKDENLNSPEKLNGELNGERPGCGDSSDNRAPSAERSAESTENNAES